MKNRNKRLIYFLLWSFICWLNAYVPFVIAARMRYNIPVMIVVIFMYAAGLTVIFLSKYRDSENNIFFRSIWIGYILNLVFAAACIPLGMISIEAVESTAKVLGLRADRGLLATFFITFLMGFLLNIAAVFLTTVVYYFQVGWKSFRLRSVTQR
ncbi:MAG: hypothetical protein GY754_19875 [bacterium]|nr:hypothetical protein [bacterium]